MNRQEIVTVASTIAAQKAIEVFIQKQKEDKEVREARRLRNTKLLLRNYRQLKLHCADIKETIQLLDMSNLGLIEDIETDELAIESIKRSKKRSLAMIQFIDRMLEVYRALCEQSLKEDEFRRFETIHGLYISEGRMTFAEIAECQNVSERTIRRDEKEAIKALSVLIFGIDGLRLLT